MKSLKFNRLFTIMLLFALFILSFGSVFAADKPSDITKHWAEKEISSASAEGWAYIENGKFSPNKAATREEVVWMLVGACETVNFDGYDKNKKIEMTFKDKPSSWAQERMSLAIGNGFINGYPDNTIKPTAPITRAEFSVLLGRLTNESRTMHSLPFNDKIPDWAFDGIAKTYLTGIIKGYPNNTFMPQANVTKAEALTMIVRWKDLSSKAQSQPANDPKELSKALENNLANDDELTLTYYGSTTNPEPDDTPKFTISSLTGNIYLVTITDSSSDTYQVLEEVLKPLLPTSSDKLINTLKNLKESETTVTYDNKLISIQKYPTDITLTIEKKKN